MQPSFYLSRLLVPVVVMTVIGSCGAGRALAQGDEPAHVNLLTGPTADWFLKLEPPPAADGRVLVAGCGRTVCVFVLGSDTNDAKNHLTALKVDDVEGCDPVGVTCCNLKSHTRIIDAEFEGQRFWLGIGEDCELSPVQEGRTDDDPSNAEPGVPFIRLAAHIWQDMRNRGVTEDFMTLATADRELRVFVSPTWQASELFLPHQRGRQMGSQILLVNHVNPPSRPPGGCATNSYCKSESGARCYTGRRHWYVKNDTGLWCEQTRTCTCS